MEPKIMNKLIEILKKSENKTNIYIKHNANITFLFVKVIDDKTAQVKYKYHDKKIIINLCDIEAVYYKKGEYKHCLYGGIRQSKD